MQYSGPMRQVWTSKCNNCVKPTSWNSSSILKMNWKSSLQLYQKVFAVHEFGWGSLEVFTLFPCHSLHWVSRSEETSVASRLASLFSHKKTEEYVTKFQLNGESNETPQTPMRQDRSSHACGVYQDRQTGKQANRWGGFAVTFHLFRLIIGAIVGND